MADADGCYKSINRGGEGEIVEKKSRFIATITPIDTKEDAERFIAEMKKKYWDARHNCSAYIIAEDGKTDLLHSSDDGEPSGTAGKPMLDVLINENVKNVCVVVTRYFGGTLLGTGGLVRAYQGAVKAGLSQCEILTQKMGYLAEIHMDYNDVGKLQYTFANLGVEILSSEYGQDIFMQILIPEEAFASTKEKVVDITSGKSDLESIEEVKYAPLKGEMKLWKKDSKKS